ncbi:zinc-ribbon domain-containing protein [Microcystis sp. BLCC-F210]|uniref:zinc-ribbon domain-containing protein n=1 Tax=Microcystis sp. BLCC-F210 TaxID=3342751 RepID=UPI0035C919DB
MISSNSLTPNQNRFKQIKRLGYNNPTFETIPTTITCQNCGKSLSLEDNFCSRCGTKKSLSSEESFAEIIERNSLIWLFGLSYAMDGGYKGWNPYIERHLAIFVNCFSSRANSSIKSFAR